MNKNNQIKNILKKLPKPENLFYIKIINPKSIPLDEIARLKCFQCGLIARAILCPPYLFKTYPQFRTMKKTKKFLINFEKAIIFIWQNDGTKSWKVNRKKLAHINFKKKFGKELKGTEVSQSREIGKLTKAYQGIFKKNGFDSFGFLNGHCDLCGHHCPRRDHPPCTRNGLPSMEACFIDVYKLLENLNIYYEYPVEELLTAVTMILIKK